MPCWFPAPGCGKLLFYRGQLCLAGFELGAGGVQLGLARCKLLLAVGDGLSRLVHLGLRGEGIHGAADIRNGLKFLEGVRDGGPALGGKAAVGSFKDDGGGASGS